MFRRGASGGRRRRRGSAAEDDVEEPLWDGPVEPGPYDVSDAPDDDLRRVDVGAMLIPVLAGTQIQFKVDEQSGAPLTVLVTDGTSAMELSVFAAPKTTGLWLAVREEILASLQKSGGGQPGEGKYGPEIRMRLQAGNTGAMVPGRMVGFDGPRWLLRAVITGKAGADEEAGPLLDEVLAGLVVVRGEEAMPVRDPVPLKLPRELGQEPEPGLPTSERTKVTLPVRGTRMTELG